MSYKLNNKVVLITGGAGGLGQALSLQLLKKGAKVIAVDIDQASLQLMSSEISHENLHVQRCDITDHENCCTTIEAARKHFGDIDILINNAGVTHFGRFDKSSAEVINRVLDINLKGAVNITHAAIQDVIKTKGCIVGISSVAGFTPLYGRAGYSASKHGLAGLMATLGAELKEMNVSVLSVYPAFIQTQKNAREGSASAQTVQRPGQASQTQGEPMTPEFAAERIIQAIEKRKSTLMLGKVAHMAWWLFRFFPTLYTKIMIDRTRKEIEQD